MTDNPYQILGDRVEKLGRNAAELNEEMQELREIMRILYETVESFRAEMSYMAVGEVPILEEYDD